jgi:hypothetical protein
MVDKRIELEIALRDTASLALKAIAENLDKINKGLGQEGGKAKEGEDAFRKIKETTEGIRKTSEEGGKTVLGVAEGLLPVSAMLLRGALGKVALWATVTKFATDMMTDGARERQEWASIAEDAGLKEGFVSMLSQAQRKLGVQPEQSKANIVNIMNSIGDMAYGPGGALSTALREIGEGDLARTMEDFVAGGQGEEALRAAFQRFDELDKVSELRSRKLADAMRMPPSFFKGMTEMLKTVQPAYDVSLKGANDWMRGWVDMMTWGADKLKTLENWGTIGSNRAFDLIGTIIDYWRTTNPLGKKTGADGLKIPDAELDDFKERNKETLTLLKQILGIFQREQNKESIEKRWVGGSVLPGRKYMVGENGPERFRSNAGWAEIIEGPDIIEPKTGGVIDPNQSTKPLWEQADRFGAWQQDAYGGTMPNRGASADWDHWRYDDQGILTARPRLPPGLSAEQNWEHLNRALTGPWGWGAGMSEDQTPPDDDPEKPTVQEFQLWQNDMEERASQWPGELEHSPFKQRGGKPGEFYNPVTGEAQGQPVNFRSMMDSELGGGAGSLGAEIVFKNVPDGVETNAEGEGFDNFTVNKTRQLQSI